MYIDHSISPQGWTASLLRPIVQNLIGTQITAADKPLKHSIFQHTQVIEAIETNRAKLINEELERNNPLFIIEGLQNNRQTFLPWERLIKQCTYNAATRFYRALEKDDFSIRSLLLNSQSEEIEEFTQSLIFRINEASSFPVLMISVPHEEEKSLGSFPGEPAPALYALAETQALIRSGLWPGLTVPKIHISYPPFLNHPEGARVSEFIHDMNPKVICLSTMAEGNPISLKILDWINEVSPESIVILGGSFHDATNPISVMRALRKIHVEPSAKIKERIRYNAYFGVPEERLPGRIVVGGDGGWLLAAILRVISNHPESSASTIHKYLVSYAQAGGFRDCPGHGEVHWFDPDSQKIRFSSASNREINRNLSPFIERKTTINRYWIFNNEETAQLMGDEGCEKACTMCHESADSGIAYGSHKISPRTPENVALEIEKIIRYKGVYKYFFDDSFFLQSPKRKEKLCNLLIELKKTYPKLEWGCQTTIPSLKDKKLVELMYRAGCTYVYIGLEGANPEEFTNTRMLKVLPREVANWMTDFKTALNNIGVQNFPIDGQHPRMRLGASLVFGIGESLEKTKEMLHLIRQYHDMGIIPENAISGNVLTNYPGTIDFHQSVHIKGERKGDYRQPLIRSVTGLEAFCEQHSSLNQEEAQQRLELLYHICGKCVVGYSMRNEDQRPRVYRSGTHYVIEHSGTRHIIDGPLDLALQERWRIIT